jgi:predicted amidohydrolase
MWRARAFENQACVLGVNRVGRDRELDYPGASALIDPMGVFGDGDRAAVLSAEAEFPVSWRIGAELASGRPGGQR